MDEEMAPSSNGWTTKTLLAYLSEQISNLDRRFTERCARMEISFSAALSDQQRANDTVFSLQRSAVETALIAAKEAVNFAFLSSKEASSKAELAEDKRFDALNARLTVLSDTVTASVAEGSGRHAAGTEIFAWLAAGAGVIFGVLQRFH